MEEIIASIGRVIAADSRAPPAPRPGAAGKSGILELTDAIEADGSIRQLAAGAPAGVSPQSAEPPPAAIEQARVASVGGAGPAPQRPPLLSAAVAEAAATAFSRLGKAPPEHSGEPEPPAGPAGRTLEAVVKDALEPLLRAWLDEHLPAIVERLVRAEIQRVARDAELR